MNKLIIEGQEYELVDANDVTGRAHSLPVVCFGTKMLFGKEIKEQSTSTPTKDFEIVQYGYAQNNDNQPDVQYIHKVKRTSDGLVFEMGEETVQGKISLFFTSNEGVMKVELDDDPFNYALISELSKKQQPKEQPYTILSFKSSLTNEIRTVNSDFTPFLIQEYIDHPKWEIYSVRRNGDNEVFTLGDRIKEMYTEAIQAFWINHRGCDLWISTNSQRGSGVCICVAKKATPVLTSEEGTPLFEGDKAWVIVGCEAKEASINKTDAYMTNKIFSKKESAHEYVIMNKIPIYLSEILSVWNEGAEIDSSKEHYASSPLFQNFKRLAEKKIKAV